MPAPAAAAAVAVAKKSILARLVKAAIAVVVFTFIAVTILGMAMSQSADAFCDDIVETMPAASPALPATFVGGNPGDPDPGELEKFMWAKRQLESGQNYQIQSQWSSASGAYQYLDSTWKAPAHKAIWSQYGDFPRAYMAPPAVQDAVARSDFVAAWHTYGNWAQVSMTHYYPAWVDDPSKWDSIPHPEAGNRMTLRQYAQRILDLMQQPIDLPPGTDPVTISCQGGGFGYTGDGTAGSMVVAAATKYIGIGYKYGGGRVLGQERRGMDCSGFTYAAYRDLGIIIGGTSRWQEDDGISVGTNLANARPGDLIMVGKEGIPGQSDHVIMYYGFINGQHMVLESNGAGEPCQADNPVYGTNPECRGISEPHPFRDSRPIVNIRRIVCGVDANGKVILCTAAAAAA